jgi:hypothetical protein
MTNYYVLIEFRHGPAFSLEVKATDEQSAQFAALIFAQGCGYDEVVKGYKVRTV